MSKRKFSVINYIESEDTSYYKGQHDGECIAKQFKKEPTFNFKSYLDGLCNGYTLEFKLYTIDDNLFNILSTVTTPLVEEVTVQTYIEHEKISFIKGTFDGINIAKNSEIKFINFKSYLDGVCDGYTNYSITSNNILFNIIKYVFPFKRNNNDFEQKE